MKPLLDITDVSLSYHSLSGEPLPFLIYPFN